MGKSEGLDGISLVMVEGKKAREGESEIKKRKKRGKEGDEKRRYKILNHRQLHVHFPNNISYLRD